MTTIKFTRDDLATASIRKAVRKGSGETIFAAYLPCGEQDFPEIFRTEDAAVKFLERLNFVRA